jgi:hypothetical protein
MYVHEEHVRNDVIKKRLKRQYCNENAGRAEPTQTAQVGDNLAESSEQDECSLMFERRGIQQLAADLIQAVDEEEEISAAEMMQSVPSTNPPTHIAISNLLDYSRAEEWLGSRMI